MSEAGILGTLFGREGPELVVECRHCGTSLDRGTAVCPVCEGEEVARYAIQ